MDKFAALFAKGGLSLDRLRTLCLVADSGSLTGAAEGDATRVSLFSRQLKELEAFFGARLVRRQGKRIALTAEGAELADLARRHFLELSEFARRCSGSPVELKLGAAPSIMEWLVMPRLPQLRETLRGCRVTLVRDGSERLAAKVRDLRLDVAIVREEALTAELKSEPLAAIGYALYVPRRLAGPPGALRRWLPDVPMMAPAEGWTRERIDAAAAEAGVALRIEVDGASATLSVRALREGHYGAILPDTAATELEGAEVVVLRPPFLRAIVRKLCVAWHPRTAAARPATLDAAEALLQWRTELNG